MNKNHKNDIDNNRNQSIQSRLKSRLSHIRRKLSRGAADIFRMIKTRGGWGNKQLNNHHESGKKQGPTDKSHK